MILGDEIKKAIVKHATRENPRECCGLIVEKDNHKFSVECRNVAENPCKTFSLSSFDYLKGSKKGNIIAIYHSHVNEEERFSPLDISNSQSHRVNYILYNLPKNSFSFFDYKKNKTLIFNKAFKTQTADCYSLVKEEFAKHGASLIDKKDSRLDPTWSRSNPGLIEEIFEMNPKVKRVPLSDVKKYDILVFELVKGNGPVHVGLYLGDDTFMHHPRDRYPCVEPLKKSYRKKIYDVYRHEKFN